MFNKKKDESILSDIRMDIEIRKRERIIGKCKKVEMYIYLYKTRVLFYGKIDFPFGKGIKDRGD